ncbi:MAG: hypothetical protein ABSB50_07755 [Terracidiphilus sp.]|jgi:hypothetical protein
MSISKTLVCLSYLAAAQLILAQSAPPTAYTVTQSGGSPGATTTISRNGSKALMEMDQPAQGGTPASRTLTLIDIAAGTNYAWDPDAHPIQCNVGTFSGDWGDPFAMTAELSDDIAKGNLKPAGSETLDGIATQIYTGTTQGTNLKVWFDQKDSLLLRAVSNMPNLPTMTLVDITKVSFVAPPASLFVLPAACAGVKPPPTAAQLIADETGDDAANYVNGSYGPGSQNSCNVVLRVIQAKTMTPITHIQVAIDTTYNQDNPPHYESGVHNDGTETFSGGGIHEITSEVHNGVVSLGTPPDYFMLNVNLIRPNHGSGEGLVYRQCFAPTTVLLYVVKDYGQQDESSTPLWVKSGKYATPPAN